MIFSLAGDGLCFIFQEYSIMADECHKLRGENSALHLKSRNTMSIRLLKLSTLCEKSITLLRLKEKGILLKIRN